MRYISDGSEVCVGDHIIVQGMSGVVVCDYDRWLCVPGYESWLTKEKMADGSSLSSGIMVDTKEAGMIHYPDDNVDVARNPGAS